jgi:membrane-associated protease RseP (regulator of RpoE activity)
MPVAIGTILFVNLLILFARSGNPALAGVLSFIAVIILVIVLHEFGHFITAKAFRIKVTEFFVGFGPRVWSVRRGETEYGIKAVPAGGYVRIAGMNPFTEEPVEDQPRTFGAKPAWQRFIVLVSGAATHFLLVILALLVYFWLVGLPIYGVAIGSVANRLDGRPSPAAVAGLEPGDQILAVDDFENPSADELIDYTRAHVGAPIQLVVDRDGERLTFTITPVLSEVEGERVGRLGVALAPGRVIEREKLGLTTAVGESFATTGRLTVEVAKRLGDVFGPKGFSRLWDRLRGEEGSLDDPVGLVGAGRLAGQAVESGSFDNFFGLFVGFNIFVGILNVLPIPPLDGGHVLLLGIEKVRGGRAVDIRRVVPVMAVVAGFLIIYTVLLLYADIFNPIPNPFGP